MHSIQEAPILLQSVNLNLPIIYPLWPRQQICKKKNIKQLNKHIQWQINNIIREFTFLSLDLNFFSLLVFTDASFANNRDLLLQISFIIILIDYN